MCWPPGKRRNKPINPWDHPPEAVRLPRHDTWTGLHLTHMARRGFRGACRPRSVGPWFPREGVGRGAVRTAPKGWLRQGSIRLRCRRFTAPGNQVWRRASLVPSRVCLSVYPIFNCLLCTGVCRRGSNGRLCLDWAPPKAPLTPEWAIF